MGVLISVLSLNGAAKLVVWEIRLNQVETSTMVIVKDAMMNFESESGAKKFLVVGERERKRPF